MTHEHETLRAALAKAVAAALQEVGLPAFKKTSLFMSSRKES